MSFIKNDNNNGTNEASSSVKEGEVLNAEKKEASINEIGGKMKAKGSQSMGTVVQSQQDINRRKKKKIIVITAICLTAVILAGLITGIILAFVNVNNENSIFYNLVKVGKPTEPKNLRIEEFDEEKGFELLIRWNDVINATSYTLECVYELHPDKVESYEVPVSGRYIERKRGELQYRVRANNKNGSSEFSDWETFYIEPMKLALPEQINYDYEGNVIKLNWTKVQYKYRNDVFDVPTYQIIDATYWYGDDPDYNENPPLHTPLDEYVFPIKKGNGEYIGDVLVIKIRAVNYTYIWTNMEKINVPVKLYEIYDVSDEWTEIEIIIEK